MANNYFKFKKFTVQQELAAMKVGTDGVLLGAWANVELTERILDVGTGTGLIALMMAQRNSTAMIDAIEIDEQAYLQAGINFSNSLWKTRLNVKHADFQSYVKIQEKKYDLIVSNPPYFSNAVKNDCDKKRTARHTDSLSFDELIEGAVSLLSKEGRFSVVLPAEVEGSFIQLASGSSLKLNKLCRVKPTPAKPPKRVLMEFSFMEKELKTEDLIVEEFGRHQYSEKYKLLTKDFYLAF